MSEEKPHQPDSRRSFFRQILLRGIERIEETGRAVGQRMSDAFDEAAVKGKGSTGSSSGWGSGPDPYEPGQLLRPPGAIPEPDFSATCSRCGACVSACPAYAIRLDQSMADGLPFIIARESPCVICEDLSCMKSCPSGALVLVERTEIRMGLAEMDHTRCLRGDGSIDHCRLCIDDCPIGETAIGLGDNGQVEVRPGCTGCGVCERACPTEPASIVVKPRIVQ